MSYFGTLKGKISDTVSRVLRVDASTNSLQTIDYPHHEVHSGSHFFIQAFSTVADASSLDFLWITPDTTKWAHTVWALESDVEMEFYLYEDVTVSDNGTGVTVFNNNRNSGTTATVTARAFPTLAGGALGDGGQGGTLIYSAKIGQGRKIGGEAGRNHEMIAKQNTSYWFKIANSSGGAGWISYDFNWYEHTNKD